MPQRAPSPRREAAGNAYRPHPNVRLDPDSTMKLTESLNSLVINNSAAISSSPLANKKSHSPLSRRASMDHRYGRSPTPCSPHTESPQRPPSRPPSRAPSRAPSTPTIKKRSSLASLNNSPAVNITPPIVITSKPGGTLSRKSSMLSVRSLSISEPPQMAITPAKREAPPIQDLSAGTTVILHDTSYQHRYSRPNTSKADLDTIVERPERIPAAVLGATSAQTRAGKSKISIRKSTRMGGLLDPEVMLVHAHGAHGKGGKTWPEELSTMCSGAMDKLKRGECEVPKGFHQGDLYLCGESREDLEGCLGAIYDAVDLVFGNKVEAGERGRIGVKRAFVCIRPPGHHCAEGQPSGFCWLNNVHIAISHAAREHGLSHAVILDFDLHHGDGSQAITWSLNDLAASSPSAKKTFGIQVPQIAYLSLHDINSYPCEYGDIEKIKNASLNLEAHGQYIHNVHLKSYTTEEEFWKLYQNHYFKLISKARDFLTMAANSKQKKGKEFKAGIFLSAGFDASEHESQGMQRHKVNVPTSFYARFASDAVALAEECCGGRVVSVLEGGYSDRALTSGVLAHIIGLTLPPPEGQSLFVPSSFVGTAMSERSDLIEEGWDESWWGIESILELEKYEYKMTAKLPPKEKSTSYLSATAASAAKKTDSPRRVISTGSSICNVPAPPPIIPWEVQAWELSRKFIPEYQESAEIPSLENSTSLNKRHSVIGVVNPTPHEGTRMTLRDRKPKLVPEPTMTMEKTRRKTTGAMDPNNRPLSRAASSSSASTRAPTPALPKVSASRRGTPVPPVTSGARKVSAGGGGTTIAGPRPIIKRTPSSASLNAAVTKRSENAKPPPIPGKQPSSNSVSPTTVRPAITNGRGSTTQELDEAFLTKFQKVKITYKNADDDEEEERRLRELQEMEKQKEELERRLQIEKEKLAKKKKSTPAPLAGPKPSRPVKTAKDDLAVKQSQAQPQTNSLELANGQCQQLMIGIALGDDIHPNEANQSGIAYNNSSHPHDNTFHGGEIRFKKPWGTSAAKERGNSSSSTRDSDETSEED
ncbi:histone deacetylase [Rhizina undulata]